VGQVENELQQGENSARATAWTLWANWKLGTPAHKAAAGMKENRACREKVNDAVSELVGAEACLVGGDNIVDCSAESL
jgi:accessory colonization factor AcfC